MASNKLIAVLFVCVVIGAALSAEKAAAVVDENFRSCINTCTEECLAENRGYTLCEMRCDSDCTEKELMDKLKTRFH